MTDKNKIAKTEEVSRRVMFATAHLQEKISQLEKDVATKEAEITRLKQQIDVMTGINQRLAGTLEIYRGF